MSENVDQDAEDTISVPLPEPVAPAAPTEETMAELADIRDAIETLGRTLAVTMTAFETMKKLIFGDGSSVVHAWPLPGVELTPCCGRKAFDLPLTERIALDPSEITCGKGAG